MKEQLKTETPNKQEIIEQHENLANKVVSLFKDRTYREAKTTLEHCLRKIQYESTIN